MSRRSLGQFQSDERAQVDTTRLGKVVLMSVIAVAVIVVVAVVGVVMVNNLGDPFYENLADFNGKLSNGVYSQDAQAYVRTGDTTGDSLFPVWIIVVGIVGSIALPTIVIGVLVLRSRSRAT